jgi:hypothetical protein
MWKINKSSLRGKCLPAHARFALDEDSASGKLIFNRTITLKDTWAKETQKS